MSFEIGDIVVDEDGYEGIVGIKYNDGDFVTLPGGNCAAHPNPTVFPTPEECRELRGKKSRPDPVDPGR